MSRRAPTIQWTICANDDEWQQARTANVRAALVSPQGALPTRAAWRQAWLLAPLLLALFTVVGTWCWRTGRHTLAQDTAGIQTTLHLEQWAATQQDASLAQLTRDPATAGDPQAYAEEFATLVRAGTSAPLSTTFDLLDIAGEIAVVRVHLARAGGSGYRQTRFYRRVGASWLRIAPSPALWGPWRTRETDHFIWRYRQQDQAVIGASADRADRMAVAIARTFGLTLTASAKIAVTVSIDAAAHTAPDAIARLRSAVHAADVTSATLGDEEVLLQGVAFGLIARAAPDPRAPLLLASPAIYLAPDDVTDEDLLLQALTLALVRRAADRGVPAALAVSPWRPLTDALKLWQIWRLDLPLAQWQQPIVRWIFAAPPYTAAAARDDLAHALCAEHRLWVEPAALHIPLLCDPNPAPAYAIKQMIPPATVLAELTEDPSAPASGDVERYSHPGTTVALATLVDYLATAYGPERLPDLLAALPEHTTWDDLLPAVYGVSAAEVQIGWCDHLATVYAITCTTDHAVQ